MGRSSKPIDEYRLHMLSLEGELLDLKTTPEEEERIILAGDIMCNEELTYFLLTQNCSTRVVDILVASEYIGLSESIWTYSFEFQHPWLIFQHLKQTAKRHKNK